MSAFCLSMARWCFELFGEKWTLEQQCAVAKELGFTAIDLADPKDWPTIFEQGLKVTCALPDMGQDLLPFEPGLVSLDKAVRQQVKEAVRATIDTASEAGVPYVIVFTGMEVGGVSSQEAVANCCAEDGFPELAKYADTKKVGLVLEALNIVEDPETWRGHPGYFGKEFAQVAAIVRHTNNAVKRDVSGRRLGFVLDPYHQHLMGDDCLSIVVQQWDAIDVVHLAGVVADPQSNKNRCEIHLPGQRIPYAEIAKELAGRGKKDLPVMCEWIPQLDDAKEGLQAAAEIFSQ